MIPLKKLFKKTITLDNKFLLKDIFHKIYNLKKHQIVIEAIKHHNIQNKVKFLKMMIFNNSYNCTYY